MYRMFTTLTLLISCAFWGVSGDAKQQDGNNSIQILSPKIRASSHSDLTSEPIKEKPTHSSLLLSERQLEQAARVLGLNHGKHYITAQDLLFISGEQTAHRWGIYHPTQTYSLGEQQLVQLKVVAWAELKQSENAMSRLQITAQTQEVRVNDVALPLDWQASRK
ncbi:hypothetical protein [Vibrio panuliri]|uniref:Uncharacterized protein n=1 Tax=Vibrio panuliri TaxID=1381081 RepID=A0ABX3FIX5_9VIBR|nr:hypothetical protein [Vibrio panuliri]KAB1460723.1 hypothetical protein F7O85_00915 [Vibrio panuliri]OLQ92151.1 hypothetical protein BIY20_08925 [Vibrio panuliri]